MKSKKWLGGPLLLILLILAGGCDRRRPIRYLIPEGYVGWVQIDYGVESAPPLPIEERAYLAQFPAHGRLETSSPPEYGAAWDRYFYYDAEGKRREIFYTGWGAGGMIWGAATGSSQKTEETAPAYSGHLFVGTEEQYRRHQSDGSSFENPGPRIGPIDAP